MLWTVRVRRLNCLEGVGVILTFGGLESSDTNISGAEDDIATKIAAADKCRNAKDPDLDIIRKVIRREEKSTRRDIASVSPDLEDCTTRLSPRYNQVLSLSRAMLVCSLLGGKSSP